MVRKTPFSDRNTPFSDRKTRFSDCKTPFSDWENAVLLPLFNGFACA